MSMDMLAGRPIADVRSEFPIFRNRPGLAYLDNAATTQVPSQVLEAMLEFEVTTRSNVHRGVYREAERATELYEYAREEMATFIGASTHEVMFTGGATQGMNMVAQMLADRLERGDSVIVSSMEHHSALLPWREAAERRGAMVTTAPHTSDFRFDLETYRLMLQNGRVRVVVVTAASNVLGTVNPIAEIVRMAHASGALVVVDAAQYVAHFPLDVRMWNADAVVFSGHKMYGPMGIGALYLRSNLADSLLPSQLGGGMVREVQRSVTYESVPWKFEAGTPNVTGALGMAAAANYLSSVGFAALGDREVELTRELIVGLLSFGDVAIVGPDSMDDRIGVVSFTFPDIHPHDLATLLGREGVAVRAGHHCAMPLVTSIDPRGVCRASLGVYTSRDDIAQFIAAIEKARSLFI